MAKIFMSYSSKDKLFAQELERRLGKEGVNVWRDEFDLRIGDSIIEKISKSIVDVDFLLAIISFSSVNSNWVKKELSFAMTNEVAGKNIVVLPLVIDDCEIPSILQDKLYADFRLPENRENAFQKLLSAIKKTDLKKNTESQEVPQHSSIASKLEDIPAPIKSYLAEYPMFSQAEDVTNKYVRTSAESFFSAVKFIYQDLTIGQTVWTTDNISLEPDFAKYWVSDGLEYLRINHDASLRGIGVYRIFIVTEAEYKKYRSILDQIGILHAMSGTIPSLAIYERLPVHSRYDFAIWGDLFVDEVVYDFKSNAIVDNYIHWSNSKFKQFKQKMAIVRNLLEPDWLIDAKVEKDFSIILQFAAQIRKAIENLPKT